MATVAVTALTCEQLIDDQRLDENRALVSEARAKSSPDNQPTKQIKVGIGRNHDVYPAARFQAFARLVEQGGDVAIGRARMPTTIGEIARLTRMLGRARQDHVEEWPRRKRRKQVCTHGADA